MVSSRHYNAALALDTVFASMWKLETKLKALRLVQEREQQTAKLDAENEAFLAHATLQVKATAQCQVNTFRNAHHSVSSKWSKSTRRLDMLGA